MNRSKGYLVFAALGALLLTPFYWSYIPAMHPSSNIALPYGGPIEQNGFGRNTRDFNNHDAQLTAPTDRESTRPSSDTSSSGSSTATPGSSSGGMNGHQSTGSDQTGTTSTTRTRTQGGMGMSDPVNEKLLQYVTEHNEGQKFLFAVSNANSASAYIIRTGKAVMAMGGYNGNDPILTVDKLKALIEKGEIKYFLLNGMGRGGSTEVTEWIKQHGTIVPSSEWEETSGSVIQNSLTDSKTDDTTSSDSRSGMMNTTPNQAGFGGMGMMTSTLYEITPEDVNN